MAYSLKAAIVKGNPRALARANGSKMYMPDSDCPKGHRSLRYTKYGQCLDCLKLSKIEYRNSEKGKQVEAEGGIRYRKENRAKIIAAVYGLSEGDVIAAKWSQNFLCKICEKPLSEGRETHIDHCHTTNKFRGILCHACNVGLGHFKDDIEILQKAIEYLSE